MSHLVHVCRTCDRNAVTPAGVPPAGTELAAALRKRLGSCVETDWEVREVACLNGCLRPCNVSYRGVDRYTYRFSRIEDTDVGEIIEFGRAYWGNPTGEVAPELIPPGLRAKLTVCTPPRGRW